jgi:hypothetical protein
MKLDEFAFFNQQLAAMLRDGIPLEGALRRLCQEMRAGSLRTELQALEADLAKGTPMADALKGRQLPELYKRMIMVGVKSGDLSGALTMLADYLQRQSSLWTRLKGLMIYPCIVLFAAFFIGLLFVLYPRHVSLGEFCVSRRQCSRAGGLGWLVDGTGHSRIGGPGGIGRGFCSADAKNVALASASFQGSQPGTSRIRHGIDVEERCASGRRAVLRRAA